jgi:hypothetical protein
VVADVALVTLARRHVDIKDIKVLVHELVDRRLRPRVASYVQ